MATIITEECINCGACEPECPNTAIYAGAAEFDWRGEKFPALSADFYYIVPEKCTECVGFFDHEACAAVCPVDCCIPDPKRPETEDALLQRAREIHPDKEFGASAPSRFRKGGNGATAAAAQAPEVGKVESAARAAASGPSIAAANGESKPGISSAAAPATTKPTADPIAGAAAEPRTAGETSFTPRGSADAAVVAQPACGVAADTSPDLPDSQRLVAEGQAEKEASTRIISGPPVAPRAVAAGTGADSRGAAVVPAPEKAAAPTAAAKTAAFVAAPKARATPPSTAAASVQGAKAAVAAEEARMPSAPGTAEISAAARQASVSPATPPPASSASSAASIDTAVLPAKKALRAGDPTRHFAGELDSPFEEVLRNVQRSRRRSGSSFCGMLSPLLRGLVSRLGRGQRSGWVPVEGFYSKNFEPKREREKRYGEVYTLEELDGGYHVRMELPRRIPDSTTKKELGLGDEMPDYDLRVSLDGAGLTVRGSVVDPDLRAVCGVSPAFPADFKTDIPLRGRLAGFRHRYADKLLEIVVMRREGVNQ